MRKLFLLTFVLFCFPLYASAHLCNDVFVQAKDNLAVKVDIRDGQLRISKEASFKVYLLNTMDRDIVNINLEIISKEFDATVSQDDSWDSYPKLKAVKSGGKKQYFSVSLARKKGVKDGTYKIDLHLFNGKNKSMVFKTVDMSASADAIELPKLSGITIDGKIKSTEWKKALLVTDFYQYVKKGRYFENVRSDEQPRYRISYSKDKLNLCFSVKAQEKVTSDKFVFLWAKEMDDKAKSLVIDRLSGEVTGDLDPTKITLKIAKNAEEAECSIPFSLLGVDENQGFILTNFARSYTFERKGKGDKVEKVDEVQYWRGNRYSMENPVIFARLNFEK